MSLTKEITSVINRTFLKGILRVQRKLITLYKLVFNTQLYGDVLVVLLIRVYVVLLPERYYDTR